MAQALYRKWRSQSFGEVVGQDPVTRTLRNAIKTGRASHAYLFCGPRGTGKTSTGRILAKALNCLAPVDGEPCNECRICSAVTEGRLIDLIEVDAASNRGIDEIRDLRDKIRFSPTEAKYKVYIVDEVHMLTDQAFNALLKTLEEPPPHAIFILATTEAHKLPATIISRCQRFDFRRIPNDDATGRLRHICAEEGIPIDEQALQMIVRNASGSLRDAENLLDQVVSYYGATFSQEDVRELLGLAGDERSRAVVAAALGSDLAGGLELLNEVAGDGVDLRQFNREIIETLRRIMLIQAGASGVVDVGQDERAALEELAKSASPLHVARAIRIFTSLDLRNDALAAIPLELAMFDVCSGPIEAEAPPVETAPAPDAPVRPAPVRRTAVAEATGPYHPAGDLSQRTRDLLERFKKIDTLIAALLRSGRFQKIDDDEVVFSVSQPGNLPRVQKRQTQIEAALSKITGHPVRFVVREASAADLPKEELEPPKDPRQELIESPLVQHIIQKHGARVSLEADS